MGVHYQRGTMGAVNKARWKAATMDLGGVLTFQGGVSQANQMRIISLMQQCQKEWEDELARQEGNERIAAGLGPIPTSTPPTANGTVPPTVQPASQPQSATQPPVKKPAKQ